MFLDGCGAMQGAHQRSGSARAVCALRAGSGLRAGLPRSHAPASSAVMDSSLLGSLLPMRFLAYMRML